ncbi:TRAP-type C4-dicarboxylate transport system substrate-binding protein [Amycolatopsis granulosa]|nr:TRAP-type C4-dicarboxylate transport system substrate-binding protein [Amycolatopsis granulosa]
MKYLLIMHMNPAVWESLSEEDRNAVMTGTARSSTRSASPAR